jgi:hypothetical protein
MTNKKLEALKEYIRIQDADEGLWFEPVIATECYLQQELRRIAFMVLRADRGQIEKEIEYLLGRMP